MFHGLWLPLNGIVRARRVSNDLSFVLTDEVGEVALLPFHLDVTTQGGTFTHVVPVCPMVFAIWDVPLLMPWCWELWEGACDLPLLELVENLHLVLEGGRGV